MVLPTKMPQVKGTFINYTGEYILNFNHHEDSQVTSWNDSDSLSGFTFPEIHYTDFA